MRQYVKDCLAAELAIRVDRAFDREHLRILTYKLSEKTQDLAEANLRVRTLIDVGMRLAGESDPIRLLDQLCSDARDLIASNYSLAAISDDGRSVVHVATAGLEVKPREISLSLDHHLFTSAMESRLPMRGLNPTGDPAFLGLPSTLPPFRSFLVAPIVSPSRAYGWFGFFDRVGANEFGREDERLAGALSAFVGRLHESNGAARLHAKELEREVACRRRAEDESARLAGMVQSSDDAIIGMALDGNILTWNPGAMGIFGYSAREVCGKPILVLFADPPAGWLDEALKVLREGRSVPRFETAGLTQAGKSLEMTVSLSPLFNANGGLSGASAMVRDVTTQRQLVQQLLIAEKMSAVGRLSAGTAHDFNNLLAVIQGCASMLLDRRTEQDAEYKELFEISRAVERAATLTRQLLTFSSRKAAEPRVVEVNPIVADMKLMLERVVGTDIQIVTALDGSLGSTRIDIGELEQVIMNLAVNARDAMPAGGTLTIETERFVALDPLTARNVTLPPGDYVTMAVTDTGTGMDAETQARIFEPFFTTKGPGQGTGLGLSVVQGIVESSGGALTVYSEPGQGTTFRVFLPRVEHAPTTLQPASEAVPPGQGTETILVVEDEETFRTLIVRVLEHNGYSVLEANDGRAAEIICEQHPGKIDLVISDLTMPGIGGVELARYFNKARPDSKVMLMSGYAETAVRPLVPPGTRFIGKPFPAQALIRKVREVLDAPELNDVAHRTAQP